MCRKTAGKRIKEKEEGGGGEEKKEGN